MASPEDTIKQLSAARDIVLQDPALYQQVVPGVIPLITQAASLPLRRWGADFLAETFASPVLNGEIKQKLCVSSPALDTIRGYINRKEELGQAEDPSVVKAAVQCAASMYPLVFRHTVNTPNDSDAWNKMAAIKSSILRKMDNLSPGVKICCIKFLAIVVLVQTAGLIADPRRPEHNEVSLALLSRDHPVLKVGILEAEASGLLDRLLSTLQEDVNSALFVTATINSLGPLVHRRASISNKIITAMFNFNPLRTTGRMTNGKDRLTLRSMTRTTIAFLLNILKRNPQHTLGARIQQQIDRLRHGLGEAFSEANLLKRPAEGPIDGLDDAKRQRIDENVTRGQQFPAIPPLPQGQVSYAQLFDLTNDSAAAQFHVELIPPQIVAQLVPALIGAVATERLDHAINAVRARYLEVMSRPPATATNAARLAIGEDDDDYDPSADGNVAAAMNDIDLIPSQNAIDQNIKIGPFHLPPPAPLTREEAQEQSKHVLLRLFSVLNERDKEIKSKGPKQDVQQRGFNRPGPGPQTREGWVQTVVRIATRAVPTQDDVVVKEEHNENALSKKHSEFDLASGIREAFFNYVMQDFRKHIGDAITWLSEEWYSERIHQREHTADGVATDQETPRYDHWSLRFLDAILPYLDTKDWKLVIRFVSEIPKIDSRHLSRLIKVADDPERITITTRALQYLITFRVPVREEAIDALEKLWRDNEDAKGAAATVLKKWRPSVIEEPVPEVKAEA